jgi:3-hydroxyisobutyrate dehydrogenase-like beta-hydroxyacid dehydrogenase
VDTAHWCSGLAKTFTPNIGHPEMQVQILRARVAELEATITTMQDEADIVQIGSNRRWDLLEEARTNFYHIDLGTTGNETASELAHRMAEKIHLELYEDLETNKD